MRNSLFRQGGWETDCHSQFENWPRNDMVFARGAGRNQRADRGVRPYRGLQEVPACGPMWASAPTERLQGMRFKVERRREGTPPYGYITRGAGKESPIHGFAVPAPLGKGAVGTGERIATASLRTGLAMTWGFT